MPRNDIVATPYGRVAIVELDARALDAALAALPAQERALAASVGEARRRALIAGRTALRVAEPSLATTAIQSDDRGAPALPAAWAGSISHKALAGNATRAVAVVGRRAAGTLGIDLEHAIAPRQAIEGRILTARERAALPADRRAVTLRFAIKEAIYKAIDPIVRRYVGFTEVELDVGDAGACAVTVVDPARLPVAVEAWWTERDGSWIAIARAHRR